MGVNAARLQQSVLSATSSNVTSLQAYQYAESKADIIRVTKYNSLTAQNKKDITDSNYQDEVLLSEESSVDDHKERTVTVNVYLKSETLPRASLKLIRSSVEKSTGVPIGTILAWPSHALPADSGVWLLCNGQSCSGYPGLVKVLGKNTVPDYRGIFLRGYGSQVSTHYGNVSHSSEALGVLQGDAVRNVTGSFPMGVDSWSGYEGVFYQGNHSNHLVGDDDGTKNYSTYLNLSRGTPTANEIRPVNRSVNWIIKAA